MKKVARLGLLCGVLVLVQSPIWAQTSLSAQQAEAQKQRAQLQQRIQQLQKNIEANQSHKKDAATALRDVETRISTTDRELATLQQRQQQVQAHLSDLQQQTVEQQRQQDLGQQQLAEQLRAQYANGLSPWATLLSGNDPQDIQRELGYLGYINQAQAERVHQLQQGLLRLQQLSAAVEKNQTELQQLAQKAEAQKQQLQTQQAEREQVFERIETELLAQQKQAQNLTQNEANLGQLIQGLEKEIAHQAELRRQAEERRRAEEARRKAEEQRRQAEEARRLAEQQRLQAEQAERQRLAEQNQTEADLAALRQAQLERDQQLAAQREAARKEDERWHALAHTPAQPALPENSTTTSPKAEPPVAEPLVQAPSAPAATEPAGGFQGLKKGSPSPVRGQQLGMFGGQRPEGGTWRGIVLQAPAGTPVKAIGAGRVVFANWMAGFGNLLIVDHGANFLSVYGNNQSVLKQVGDIVAQGDVIARVGATGGQVEPGVYIEIRHHGQPVNPQLWLGN